MREFCEVRFVDSVVGDEVEFVAAGVAGRGAIALEAILIRGQVGEVHVAVGIDVGGRCEALQLRFMEKVTEKSDALIRL